MKNRRKKVIITAGILAAVVSLGVMLACNGSPEGETVRKDGQEKLPETVVTKHATEEKRSGLTETERCIAEPETTVYKETKKGGMAVIRGHSAHGETENIAVGDYAAYQEEESTSASDTAVHQETQPQTEPMPIAHVHSYELADTRTVEHPAVTEQVWVVDSEAWDEVIRDGYHVCVVTCHECGAQFADTSQADALEAWGDHIDAAHDGDGGYDMAASYDVPPEVIHHDATGHYETRTVTAAWTEYIDTYRCSCGDSYTQTR